MYVLSQGPRASIRARHDVPISRPRDLLEARQHPIFGTLVQRLWSDLSGEAAPVDYAL